MSLIVLEREENGQRVLLAYQESGRLMSGPACEEVGEDHGFYDPRAELAHAYGEYKNARIIREGFTGELCEHRIDRVIHFSRNPYGYIHTCGKCGVSITESYRKRAHSGTFSYGEWELREHIWRKWAKLGPVPGSLVAQPHHGKSEGVTLL